MASKLKKAAEKIAVEDLVINDDSLDKEDPEKGLNELELPNDGAETPTLTIPDKKEGKTEIEKEKKRDDKCLLFFLDMKSFRNARLIMNETEQQTIFGCA